jgi:hypothetical protein
MKHLFRYDNNWNSYRPFLFQALEMTKKGTVLEYGMGDGSTKLLHDYCKSRKRQLFSFDSNADWANKFMNLNNDKHVIASVTDWDSAFNPRATVVLIDHAAGERRKEDVKKYAETDAVLIVHDTEPAADHGYQMRQYFDLYKYRKDYETDGAWATALSNKYDVTTFEA